MSGATEERRRLYPCPACAAGYLHSEPGPDPVPWDPSCSFALVDPERFGSEVAFAHCHSCGAVMPDDYAVTGRYTVPRELPGENRPLRDPFEDPGTEGA